MLQNKLDDIVHNLPGHPRCPHLICGANRTSILRMAIRLPDVSTCKCMKNRRVSVTLIAPMQTLHDAKRALTESGQQAVAQHGVCFAVVMTK